MKIIKTDIEGVVIIEPRLFKDDRGYFFESFSQSEFDEKVRKVNFVQDNESKSSYGVLRGLHFQKPPHAQSKLVRVIKGAVLDVANIWTICSCRTDRRQSSSIFHPSWICSWLQCSD